MLQDQPSEDTPSKLLVGVLKVEHHIGLLPTHGMRIGEIKDSSKSEEGPTNAESKVKSLLVSQPSRNQLKPNNDLCMDIIVSTHITINKFKSMGDRFNTKFLVYRITN